MVVVILRCGAVYRVPGLAEVPAKRVRCDLPADVQHAMHCAFLESRRSVEVDGALIGMGELRWPDASVAEWVA